MLELSGQTQGQDSLYKTLIVTRDKRCYLIKTLVPDRPGGWLSQPEKRQALRKEGVEVAQTPPVPPQSDQDIQVKPQSVSLAISKKTVSMEGLLKAMGRYYMGRPSTYAHHIRNLHQRGWIAIMSEQGKVKSSESVLPPVHCIVLTKKGRDLLNRINKQYPVVSNPAFCAWLEQQLNAVENGEPLEPVQLINACMKNLVIDAVCTGQKNWDWLDV